MRKIEIATRIAIKYIEAINEQQAEAIKEYISAECVWETSTQAEKENHLSGIEEILEYWKSKFIKGQRLSIKIEEVIGFGLRCILFEEIHEENNQELRKTIRGVEIFEVKGEKIQKIRSYVKA